MNKITHASPLDLYEVKSGATIHPGALVALDSDGKAVPAADTAGITVIGVAARIFDGCCEVESGIVALAGDAQKVFLPVYLVGAQIHQFAHAQPAAVEHFQNSAVAGAVGQICRVNTLE